MAIEVQCLQKHFHWHVSAHCTPLQGVALADEFFLLSTFSSSTHLNANFFKGEKLRLQEKQEQPRSLCLERSIKAAFSQELL